MTGPGRVRSREHRPDLRLYGLAAGAWGAALACLPLPAATTVKVGAAAALVALVSGVVSARWPRERLASGGWAASDGGSAWHASAAVGVLVTVLLGAVCACAATAAKASARDTPSLAALARAQSPARVELTVSDDPRPLRGGGPGPPQYVIAAHLTGVEAGRTTLRGLDVRILVFATAEGWPGLLPGQRVRAEGRLASPRGGDLTAAVLRASGSPEPVGAPPWTQRAAGTLRAGLRQASAPLPGGAGGLLPGLVIGDTSRLDPALKDDFQATGMSHLVAVSGANLAVILTIVLLVCRWCRVGPGPSAVICVAALIGFVILARPSPSVVRAAAMGAIGLVALATGRSRAAAPALAAGVFAVILIDPDLARDAGFALSALATGGLVLIAPGWRDALRARGVPTFLADALAAPAAAQVVCGPVIAAISGTVSLVAIPANLLAAPAVAPATLLGVGAAVVSPVWPTAAAFLAWLASWPARWLAGIAHVGAGVPAGALGWPDGLDGGLLLAAVTLVLLLAWRRPLGRRIAIVALLATAAGAAPVRLLAPGWPPPGAVVIACAVGQGDAIVLPIGTDDRGGAAVVVDAGPDPDAVDGCLKELRITTIPLLVLTHLHADHVAGLAGVLRGRRVAAVALPAHPEPAAGGRGVREAAAARGVPIVRPEAGWAFTAPDLSLTVIGPVRQLTGTRSDPNNNSLVLRAVARGVTILLAGDAETEEQRELIEALGAAPLRVDVVKVAHHGSAYQDEGFLDAVRPAVALVSVGAGNMYGHPNLALLTRLARGGARVLRTDRDGDCAVVSIDGDLGVVVHRSGRTDRPSVQTASDHVVTTSQCRDHVGRCRRDAWPLRPSAPRHGRRGTARCARHRRSGGRGARGRSDDPGYRARRVDHDRRRPLLCRQPLPLRRLSGGRGPRRAGREEGPGRRAHGIRGAARGGRLPRRLARRRRQGQGARRQPA